MDENEIGKRAFSWSCAKVKEKSWNRNGWFVRADTIPRRRGRSLETWRNNVSLEERLTRSRWTEHRGSQSFRDRFLIHLPRSFINILQLGGYCARVYPLPSSPHPTWTNEPAEFRALDHCERPALPPSTLRALTLATSNLLKFDVLDCRVHVYAPSILSLLCIFPTNDYILLLDRFINANSKDRSKKKSWIDRNRDWFANLQFDEKIIGR